ncbi:MAG: hypothetical protein J3R72DRAFT_214853 [Linnemannia gamsii]|nr:MAG: hypothetical protein J3R72DRAFT_214853 [Linnemannia gamsii]
MSDSIGHDATPHPRDASSPHHNTNKNHDSGDSDSDDVSTPPFLSRPHSRQSNTSSTPVVVAGAESATTTTHSKPREAFRPSVFGTHTSTTSTTTRTTTKETSSRSKSKSTHSRKASGTDALESDDSDSGSSSGDEKTGAAGGGGRRRKGSRRRRFSDSASHLLAQAPPVPDLRFDNNYRKALNQIYETHAKETAAAAASGTTIDASDEKKSASGTALQQTQSSSLSSSSKKDRKVPGIAARVTVMTVRDIIIMPFIHGFFWGFGTIMLTLAGQRSLMYHVQRTWRKTFGDGNADEVMNLSRGQPARVRRVGGGFGGVGLMNAGSASAGGGGFARPAGHY